MRPRWPAAKPPNCPARARIRTGGRFGADTRVRRGRPRGRARARCARRSGSSKRAVPRRRAARRAASRVTRPSRSSAIEVGEDLPRRSRPQAPIDVAVDRLHQSPESSSGPPASAARISASRAFAVRDVFVDLRARVEHLGAVPAVDDRRVAVVVAQAVQRALVRAHVAVGRRDRRRCRCRE